MKTHLIACYSWGADPHSKEIRFSFLVYGYKNDMGDGASNRRKTSTIYSTS